MVSENCPKYCNDCKGFKNKELPVRSMGNITYNMPINQNKGILVYSFKTSNAVLLIVFIILICRAGK